VAYLDDFLGVRELIRSLFFFKRVRSLDGALIIHCNCAHLFFHVSNIFIVVFVNDSLTLIDLPDKLLSNVFASNVNIVNSVRHGITLKNWHGIADTFTALYYETCSLTG
jgi:hypothetical protein